MNESSTPSDGCDDEKRFVCLNRGRKAEVCGHRASTFLVLLIQKPSKEKKRKKVSNGDERKSHLDVIKSDNRPA